MTSLIAGATTEVGAVAAGWRAWLAHEKRQAPASVKAYQTDLIGFLGFCAEHRGGPPTLDELSTLAAGDFRAWLAWRHRQGRARTSTARALAALRSFYRYLDRQHGRHNPALKALRTPRLPKRLPRPLSSPQARALIDHVAGGRYARLGRGARSGAAAAAVRRGPADRRGARPRARRARPRARGDQ